MSRKLLIVASAALLAARPGLAWNRAGHTFDHSLWHYIDYPYKPKGEPASVPAPAPPRGISQGEVENQH